MMLIIALLLIILFAGLGFFVKVLWWGVVLGAILLIADAIRR